IVVAAAPLSYTDAGAIWSRSRRRCLNKDRCVWTITGDVPDVRSSAERKAVLTAMQEIGGEATGNANAASAELKQANVRRMLARLAEKGNVQRCGRGKYKLADGENSHAG